MTSQHKVQNAFIGLSKKILFLSPQEEGKLNDVYGIAFWKCCDDHFATEFRDWKV